MGASNRGDRAIIERRVEDKRILRIVTWNVEWARPSHAEAITHALVQVTPDVLVVTEGREAILPRGGYVVLGGPDWGYPTTSDRRKVLAWSRFPLTDVNWHVDVPLPPGRLLTATCQTPLGPWWVVGVCIPWRDAHVRTGRKDASPWQEHLDFLAGLPHVLTQAPAGVPVVVAGDFNQRVPRQRTPTPVSSALTTAMTGLTMTTEGTLPGLAGPGVDHVARSADLVALRVGGVDRRLGQSKAVSDHDLVWADLAPTSSSSTT